jgi:hypothetical protein
VFKKQMQLQQARQSIISSADKLLESSFVGSLASILNKVRDAIAQILVSDQKQVRNVMEQVLTPYVNLSDRDFVKVARKAVNDLFDWAVQTTNKQWTNQLYRVLVDNNRNVAKYVSKFKDDVMKDKEHPLYNNQILKLMSFTDSAGDHLAVKNIKIKNKENNKVYDQNQMIYAFQELKDYLYAQAEIPGTGISGKNFYKNIAGLAFLQSGLSTSNISFTEILPYDDFVDIYADVLAKINTMDNLQSFKDLGVLYRNNWSDDTFTPFTQAKWIMAKATGKKYYNLNMAFGGDTKGIQEAINKGEIPQMLNISVGSPGTNQDMMTYSWEVTLDKDYKKDRALKKAMRAKGDYSYIKKGLFQKVYIDGDPVIYNNYNENYSYLYKMVNAWGYGRNANEFYDVATTSKLDNGFVKVEQGDGIITNKFGTKKVKFSPERSDEDILEKILPIIREKLLPSFSQISPSSLLADEAATDDVLEATNVSQPTQMQGLNERLNSYGNAKVILSSDFNQGPRPVGRLNSFKSSIIQVADNLQILADLNLDEFNFLTESDKKRLNALRPLAKELNKLNTSDISSAATRTVEVEKKYAQLTNQLTNEFVDIIGKHVEEQLGKKITASQSTETTQEETENWQEEDNTCTNPIG